MNIYEKVDYVLKKYEDARNNDNILIARVLFDFYKEFIIISDNKDATISLNVFPHLPSFETITRARRRIQKRGNIQKSKNNVNKLIFKK